MGRLSRLTGIAALLGASASGASAETDEQAVARLDLEYQAAVKRHDAAVMDRILHPDFILVRGNGQTVTRAEILDGARTKAIDYAVQDEEPGTQTVRVYGDSAMVTALLNIKGRTVSGDIERRVWFSDLYIRTPQGWRYVFAQVSLPLP